MDLSSDWRSLWAVSSSFSAPCLAADAGNGPLRFTVCHPARTLLYSPSLLPHIPPPAHPATLQRDFLSFFRSSPDQFFPSAIPTCLLNTDGDRPTLANNLHALPSRRRPDTLFLFFPLGDNAQHIGYLGLSLNRIPVCDSDGDVFRQREGFCHPHHRITHITLRPEDDDDGAVSDGDLEGHLLATTTYSVSWFRIDGADVGPPGSRRRRPVLLPVARQAFREAVVWACWNPHLAAETAVLLASGKVLAVDLRTRRASAHAIPPDLELGDPLCCEYGGQPWIVFVAGSNCVMAVDLRPGHRDMPTVLARIDNSDVYKVVHSMTDDRIILFRRADFDHSFLAVVTTYHLLLFDERRPLHPLLTWDHGICNPCNVEMFRLSDLRSHGSSPSDGYAILVASLWEDTFKLFCYGPCSTEGLGGPLFYAWELPSRVSFSGQDYCCSDDLLRDEFFKYAPPCRVGWQEKKDLVLGFHVCSRSCVGSIPGSNEVEGFELLRIMSSGKLQVQRYRASSAKSIRKSSCERKPIPTADVSLFYSWSETNMKFRHLDTMKLNFLNAYLNGELMEVMAKNLDGRRVNGAVKSLGFNHILWWQIKDCLSYYHSESVFDVTFPISMHEIACRRILLATSASLLYLSFSTYQELSRDHHNFSLELFEVPGALVRKRASLFLTGKPSQRSTKWSHKVKPGDALLGPILPLPVICALQHFLNAQAASSQGIFADCFLLDEQCDQVRSRFLPQVSLANADDIPTKVDHSLLAFDVSGCPINDKNSSSPSHLESLCASKTFNNPNFSSFVSGAPEIHDEASMPNVSMLDVFDNLTCVTLDYEWPDMQCSSDEESAYKFLGKQFFKWQWNFSPLKEFYESNKI